jgi:hypothetical protein
MSFVRSFACLLSSVYNDRKVLALSLSLSVVDNQHSSLLSTGYEPSFALLLSVSSFALLLSISCHLLNPRVIYSRSLLRALESPFARVFSIAVTSALIALPHYSRLFLNRLPPSF